MLVLSISNQTTESKFCENQAKPLACESLPNGIISRTTNLEMQHLWKLPHPQKNKITKAPPKTLLAMAIGIKQKKVVDKIVSKFSSVDSNVMLFHYDGFVNEWRDFLWTDRALHIFAANQRKWWFSKRFLHPDVVAEYDYIFIWDEDVKVDSFNPKRYLSVVVREQLEISQPKLDSSKFEAHHRPSMHASWVKMMAPVFSKAAWRCAWHLIQNDLIQASELDYCAQGDITKKFGIVDKQYIVHRGIPTSGGSDDFKASQC
ncbi:uncharacterized protein LOC110027362 isoform X1 [Phalaenopsis equestris]|nr:uncharacterized protein LOC110027362 isoform X1 [Phalaenopsis equestris]